MNKRVIAAVIERNGHFLVCKRPAHKHHGNLWEFPGGKLEPDESLPQAASRELKEELALKVTRVGDIKLSVSDAESGFIIEFVEIEAEGTIELLEHADFVWATVHELLDLPLAPSDRRFAEYLSGLE
ncbi:MAG TPA: NUDIX domain-containing protein [Candidatus Obscuribacterales bacterium]